MRIREIRRLATPGEQALLAGAAALVPYMIAERLITAASLWSLVVLPAVMVAIVATVYICARRGRRWRGGPS